MNDHRITTLLLCGKTSALKEVIDRLPRTVNIEAFGGTIRQDLKLRPVYFINWIKGLEGVSRSPLTGRPWLATVDHEYLSASPETSRFKEVCAKSGIKFYIVT